MSFAALFTHLSVPVASIGFAVAMVLTLVAAEERDLRRTGSPAEGAPRA